MAGLSGAGSGESERTVSFFEVRRRRHHSPDERVDHVDWQGLLRGLDEAPLESRVHATPTRTYVGEVLHVEARLHLKLMQVRDEDAWLELYSEESQSIGPLNLGQDQQLLESSVVAFLDYGNVVGLIRGSANSPAQGALADWINGLRLFKDMEVAVWPMMAHEAQQRLRAASEVSQVSVQVHTNKADVLDEGGVKLGGILRAIKKDYGPMTVEITLKPGRSKGAVEGRQAVKAESERIADVANRSDGAVEKASARLMHFEPDGSSRTEDLDFAQQRVTAKTRVLASDEEGNPIRNASAVRAILKEAESHDRELRAIVEAGNDGPGS